MSVHTSKSSNSANAVIDPHHDRPPEALVSRKFIEKLTGFSRSTLDRYLADGRFPTPVMVGRKRRWYYGDVINWLRSLSSNKEGSTNG